MGPILPELWQEYILPSCDAFTRSVLQRTSKTLRSWMYTWWSKNEWLRAFCTHVTPEIAAWLDLAHFKLHIEDGNLESIVQGITAQFSDKATSSLAWFDALMTLLQSRRWLPSYSYFLMEGTHRRVRLTENNIIPDILCSMGRLDFVESVHLQVFISHAASPYATEQTTAQLEGFLYSCFRHTKHVDQLLFLQTLFRRYPVLVKHVNKEHIKSVLSCTPISLCLVEFFCSDFSVPRHVLYAALHDSIRNSIQWVSQDALEPRLVELDSVLKVVEKYQLFPNLTETLWTLCIQYASLPSITARWLWQTGRWNDTVMLRMAEAERDRWHKAVGTPQCQHRAACRCCHMVAAIAKKPFLPQDALLKLILQETWAQRLTMNELDDLLLEREIGVGVPMSHLSGLFSQTVVEVIRHDADLCTKWRFHPIMNSDGHEDMARSYVERVQSHQ